MSCQAVFELLAVLVVLDVLSVLLLSVVFSKTAGDVRTK